MLWHLLHSYSLHNYVSGLCSDEASAMALAVLSSAKLRQVLWHCRLSGLVNLRRVLVSYSTQRRQEAGAGEGYAFRKTKINQQV